MLKNNAKIWRNVSAVIAWGGVGLFFGGILLDSMDAMWMIMVGIMIAATFFICQGVFARQARDLGGMFRGDGLLAHFRFGRDEVTQRIGTEEKTRKKTNKFLLAIIGAFFAGLTLLFVIFGFDDPEDALFFVILMAAVFGIILLAALLAPGAYKKKASRSPGEVFIGIKGTWVFGEYLVWDAFLTRLVGIGFQEGENGCEIAVTYQRMQRHGWQTADYRIPVPRGQEEEARRASETIARAHRMKLG